MTVTDLIKEVRQMQLRLRIMEARLRELRAEKGGSFADLAGLWAGQSDSSPDDIDAVLFRVPDDLEDIGR